MGVANGNTPKWAYWAIPGAVNKVVRAPVHCILRFTKPQSSQPQTTAPENLNVNEKKLENMENRIAFGTHASKTS